MRDRNIERHVLRDISRHYKRLGLKYFIRGLPYERCAELPYIIRYLKDHFDENLRYLDIGSGESPLPTYFLKHTNWDISCVDKFSWVRRQADFSSRVMKKEKTSHRFHIIENDFLSANFLPASFDIITNISVIEHFDGDLDKVAMDVSGKLLRPAGLYILTTLINERFPQQFFWGKEVYGVKSNGKQVFYQRHYDLEQLRSRIITPSGLQEKSRVYFGDYGFQCFERVFQCTPKVLSLLFRWASPVLARRFLSYSDRPLSRSEMRMNTASGVILILTRL